MNSKVLNGSQRVVMDGVISDDECQELQRLTNVRNPVTALLPTLSAKHLLGAAVPAALGVNPTHHTPMGTCTHMQTHPRAHTPTCAHARAHTHTYTQLL